MAIRELINWTICFVRKQWIAVLLLIVIIVMIISYKAKLEKQEAELHQYKTLLRGTYQIDGFKSKFTPDYMKELELFKTLSADDQHAYLTMSKEEKLQKYGSLL